MKKRKIRLSAILLFLVMIILIPTTLSIYRETKTKTLGINLTHPNYNLTLDADGGTIPTTSGYTNSQDNKTATKVVTYGHEYGTLPTPVKEGYRFDGWNGKNLLNYNNLSPTALANGISVDSNGNISDSTPTSDGRGWLNASDQNWYTNLSSGTYTISLKFYQVIPNDEGRQYSGLGILNIDTGSIIRRIVASELYNKTNYNCTFSLDKTTNIGIMIKAYDGIYRVQLEEGNQSSEWEPYYVTSSTNVTQTKNHTLKAKYTPNTYSIVFDKNDTNATGTMNNQTFTYDTTQNLTPNAYTKTGYTFTGWNTEANGSGTAYLDGVSVNNLTTTNNGTVTLYAQWIANTYTVTLDGNGGTIPTTSGWTNAQDNETSTKTLAYDSPYGTLPEPTKEGYIFNGWNGKNLFDIGNKNDYYMYYSDKIEISNNSIIGIVSEGAMTYIRNEKFKYLPGTYLLGATYNYSIHRIIIYAYDSNDNVLTNEDINISGFTYNNVYRGWFLDSTENDIVVTIPNQVSYWKYGTSFSGQIDDSKTISNIKIIKSNKNESYEPYYVTSLTNVTQAKNHTLKAVWEKKEATFDTGKNFNVKIKQLANPALDNITYETGDTNITSIVRANSIPSSWVVNDVVTPPSDNNIVSTSDSKYPIYAWFDNGIIYYYTEALNPFMNTDAQSMFRGLKTCTSIDVSSMDTSKTQKMLDMFYGDYVLTSLDLSNFNTSNVDDMYAMFFNCKLLKTINLSSFDTSKVTRMGYMFSDTIIENLDISSFDMTLVTNINKMLNGMTSLQSLKTPNTYPTDTSVTIDLPTTLYDTNGNSYTTLTSTSLTSTWLKLEYQPYSITYDLDGGSLSNTNPSTYNINSSSITLNNPTKTNYIFKGWSGGKNLFNPNDWTINNGAMWGLTGSFTSTGALKMQGNPTITNERGFYLMGYNGGTFEYSNKKISFMNQNSSNSAFLSQNGFGTVNNTDYIQAVLNANNESTADIELNIMISDETNPTPYEPYISEQTTVTIPSGSSGNRTYKAIWEPNYYTITFDSNGGTGTMNDQIVGVGATATLNANTFTKTGKKFVGWNTRADGQGTAYLDQDSISSLGSATDTITLYAQWVQLMAEDIGYDGNAVNCNNVQCMIDELYNMLN